jgi:glycerol-3-phosphate O-acyltransferase
MINKGLAYLKDFIENKREIFEPLVSAKSGEKSILMLSYYRNNLTHVFINEAEIACTLLGYSTSLNANAGFS